MASDAVIIASVEVVRILLNAAFTYAEINKIPKEEVKDIWLKSFAKIDELDPKNLPEVE